MLLKPCIGLALAFLFVCSSCPALAQTVPSATESIRPFSVGAGISGFNPDYEHGHLLGGTLWVDYQPNQLPRLLHGLGVEAEARDLNYGRSSTQPSNLREDTAEGGLIYSWLHYRKLHPYGKYMMGYGNADYMNATLQRYHQTRTISCFGGGVELRASRNVWVRAEYEYQSWPNFFKHPENIPPAGLFNPQGFTVGALYHFGHRHFQ